MEGKRSFIKATQFSSSLFPILRGVLEGPTLLDIFTSAEHTEIRDRVLTPNRKNAGEGLKRAIEALITHRQRYDETLQKIKDIIDPNKVHTRQSKEEIERQANLAAIQSISTSLEKMPEKLLRSFAETVLGDSHLDYTAEELPTVIACKQLGIPLTTQESVDNED